MPIDNCYDCIYRRTSNSLIHIDYCILKEREVTKYIFGGFPTWCPLPDINIINKKMKTLAKAFCKTMPNHCSTEIITKKFKSVKK